ncbi:MAG TPA: biotin--[acetyl-CoA-carboxylase] ligase [Mariprofundaceae bacterium]|nr:biotin--[acetyl-CoA-carboxylase] ligase [Mariprofundaceae bacterium]
MTHPVQQRILTRLAGGPGPVSGHELAAELGLSRTAVWKHVQALRRSGIRIRSESGRGYILESDRFTAEALAMRLAIDPPARIGQRILCLETVDSTNLEALRAADADAPEGLVIIAEQQQHGRGRLGRTWHTLTDDALALSVLLRPSLPPERVSQIPLVVGVALYEAFRGLGAEVAIKWPNDILHRGAKLAGILTEMRAEPGHVQAVVAGIGINVRHPENGWPDDIQQAVTDLATAARRPMRRLEVAERVIRSLDACYGLYLHEGFDSLRDSWWSAHAGSGTRVRVHDGGGYVEGTAIAIDHDGALLLSTGDATRRIIAGDLELMGAP